jgi:hypothetical protein
MSVEPMAVILVLRLGAAGGAALGQKVGQDRDEDNRYENRRSYDRRYDNRRSYDDRRYYKSRHHYRHDNGLHRGWYKLIIKLFAIKRLRVLFCWLNINID